MLFFCCFIDFGLMFPQSVNSLVFDLSLAWSFNLPMPEVLLDTGCFGISG
jgi:hypothetical protein